MTQEEKNLLSKELCSRLPYDVKVNNEIHGDFNIYGIVENFVFVRNEVHTDGFDIEKIKPYLFPLSSLTEEQRNKFPFESSLLNAFIDRYIFLFEDEEFVDNIIGMIDWFNKNHIDYRGLIPMGLALDATNLNIY